MFKVFRPRECKSEKHGASRGRRAFVLLVAMAAASQGYSQRTDSRNDLTTLSVDDLLNVEVTSVARRGQKLSETPAAVFVITSDDIRRSGAGTIPDLLRLVPGFDVSSVSGNVWAASTRGFAGRWSSKLLVLIDGRSVYNPLFSGVYWDQQDVFFEDIERIEVIRGPGGTLWGANAVNGVINIITKDAVDTQGTLLSSRGGTEAEGATAGARHGGRIGRNGYYRVYGKAFDRPESGAGESANDLWRMWRGGVRADWTAGAGSVRAEAEAYGGEVGAMASIVSRTSSYAPQRWNTPLNGGHLLFRWESTQSKRSETSLQASFQTTSRRTHITEERLQTTDLDFQHSLTLGRHNPTWGVSYRVNDDELTDLRGSLTYTPAARESTLVTAFLQDEFRITPNFRVTAGSKVQYDELSDVQWQPSLRAIWFPTPNQAVWSAATRSVRTPSRFERDSMLVFASVPTRGGRRMLLTIEGYPQLDPEAVMTYEFGYRAHGSRISVDVTAFRNSLEHLIALDPESPYVNANGQLTAPLVFRNALQGTTRGAEIFATFQATPRWDVTAGYALLDMDLVSRPEYNASGQIGDMIGPRHQWQLRSFLTVTPHVELDTAFYYVGARQAQSLGSYVRTDVRLSWQPRPPVEISLIAQDVFNRSRIEFNGAAEQHSIAPTSRSFSGAITWRF